MMSKEHKKCGKKGECKKEFCKKAENDNAAKGPAPAADPNAPKKPDAGCCKPKKDGKKGCGC
jgi:hypothetical protein